ncbi:MAG: hypothetical protein KC457_31810, partial [Myxococcales bacterium]|nr:hypothetical protein [Myxococcales bacterium]
LVASATRRAGEGEPAFADAVAARTLLMKRASAGDPAYCNFGLDVEGLGDAMVEAEEYEQARRAYAMAMRHFIDCGMSVRALDDKKMIARTLALREQGRKAAPIPADPSVNPGRAPR